MSAITSFLPSTFTGAILASAFGGKVLSNASLLGFEKISWQKSMLIGGVSISCAILPHVIANLRSHAAYNSSWNYTNLKDLIDKKWIWVSLVACSSIPYLLGATFIQGVALNALGLLGAVVGTKIAT